MLIDDLLTYHPGSLERLSALSESNPESAIDVAWGFVRKAGRDGRHVPSDSIQAIGLLLKKLLGEAQFQSDILSYWPQLGPEGQEIIAYQWASTPNFLSDSLLIQLIQSEAVTRGDRITLLNSLMATRDSRSIRQEVLLNLIQMTRDVSPPPSAQDQRYLDGLQQDLFQKSDT